MLYLHPVPGIIEVADDWISRRQVHIQLTVKVTFNFLHNYIKSQKGTGVKQFEHFPL